MKTTRLSRWHVALRGLFVCAALMLGQIQVQPAIAQEQGQLFAAREDGYARLILSFPGRNDLPQYTLKVENGVLSLVFAEPVSVLLPDVGTTLPDYLSVARVDPDGRGLRLGLRSSFNYNRTEAGEKLFVDLMPTSWQGLPPALPQEVIDELAERARLAAIKAEQDRKAAGVKLLDPRPVLRIGRNPTFLRLQFNWNVPTEADYVQEGENGILAFEWPVPVDLLDLQTDLPPEIASVESAVTPDGASVHLHLGKNVTPRFYKNSAQEYVLDIDIAGKGLPSFTAASLATDAGAAHGAAHEPTTQEAVEVLFPPGKAPAVKPFVSILGSTVRLIFPFDQDTPAAVFRRGDTVWMLFDTVSGITPPDHSSDLDAVASKITVTSAGDTQLVRMDLAQDRLATLGSEGMAWVLSLGDIMLNPTEPMHLSRRRDVEGNFQVVADIRRPGRVHSFEDPQIGDTLEVVTAYPPARGVGRLLDYVEFSALRSIHGLVIKPKDPTIALDIENELAVIKTPGGLTVSTLDAPRAVGNGITELLRGGFVDLKRLEQPNPAQYARTLEDLSAKAAATEGYARDEARLELADFYLANQFALEANGVLSVLKDDLSSDALAKKILMSQAIAATLAHRPADALSVLDVPSMGQELDALIWRTIARAQAEDFTGARQDALEAKVVIDAYPVWVRNAFTLAAIRAALESKDVQTAEHLMDEVDVPSLSAEDASLLKLFSARLDEVAGNTEEAIDTYGQVIADDIRPTRAEAVYRTLLLLDQQGRLDPAKATSTLAAEAMLWRGDTLEANMQKLLADLYFREGQYRPGFETVKQAVAHYPESRAINGLRDKAQEMFSDLFLNGKADTLGPVEALSLYYDFRELTPAGTTGDEMIRNLARRLVKVDLLPQAAELLQYQLDNRLRGVARTQVAADLAVIYLADRKPQEAIKVLNATRLPDIPASLARQRRVLEARAMIDGGRDQLALDLLRDVDGRESTLLRIDAHWRAKRFAQAAEMIEALEADEPRPLSQPARMSLIKAGVGYVLANDRIGLSRLRSKFGDAMVTSPEWPMFDLVTGQANVNSLEFKTVAAQVSDLDGINAFLASYRQTYEGQGAVAPLEASTPNAAVASAG